MTERNIDYAPKEFLTLRRKNIITSLMFKTSFSSFKLNQWAKDFWSMVLQFAQSMSRNKFCLYLTPEAPQYGDAVIDFWNDN